MVQLPSLFSGEERAADGLFRYADLRHALPHDRERQDGGGQETKVGPLPHRPHPRAGKSLTTLCL